MLKILENKNEIRDSQALFLKSFEPYITAKIPVRVGYSGGNFPDTVLYSSRLNIWLSTGISADNRYWNGFGIEKPKEGAMIPLTCEINFPKNGINRTIGGAFATDESGQTIVLHRGKIGGGRKGIGKNLFENAYRGKWVDALDGDTENSLALIGSLDSHRLPQYVSHFVHEVARIKRLSDTEVKQINSKPTIKDFNKEFSGSKKYKTKKDIDAECNHGLVVNELASYLTKEGYKVGNDTNRDLYIFTGQNRIKTLFEIKTDISTSNIYSGIGQLLLNSLDYEAKPNLVLVLPKEIRHETKDKIAKLGIKILLFGWKEDIPVFTNISSISHLFT
jgi:hypothetical protein